MSNPENKELANPGEIDEKNDGKHPDVDLVGELNNLVKEGVLTVEDSKHLGMTRKDLELPVTVKSPSREEILPLFHTDDFPRPHLHSSKQRPLN